MSVTVDPAQTIAGPGSTRSERTVGVFNTVFCSSRVNTLNPIRLVLIIQKS